MLKLGRGINKFKRYNYLFVKSVTSNKNGFLNILFSNINIIKAINNIKLNINFSFTNRIEGFAN